MNFGAKLPSNARKTAKGEMSRGFTLVELLVVVGIVTLLIALLLPALSKAQEEARKTKCLSNVRQLAMAAIMYANENKGRFPLEVRQNNTGFNNSFKYNAAQSQLWPGDFMTAMYTAMGFPDPGNTTGSPKAVSELWQCPSNPYFNTRNSFVWFDLVCTSYMYFGNGWGKASVGAIEKDYNMRPQRLGMTGPSGQTLPLFGDKVQYATAEPLGRNGWIVNHDFALLPGNKLKISGANQSFADGHAEWVTDPYVSPLDPATSPAPPLGAGTGNYSAQYNPNQTWGMWWWY